MKFMSKPVNNISKEVTELKRKLSLILVILMTIMAWMPAEGLAQEDKALEQAIRAAKAKIEIPESFTEFSYNAGTDRGKTVWYLDWTGKDRMEGSLNVRVDEDGTILSYNFYRPYQYDSTRKFPKVSRHQAAEVAEGFIERMQPGLVSELKPVEDSELLQMGSAHRFNYVRLENGIPYRGNTVNVEVNSETGEVQSYYCNWSQGLAFPDPGDVISRQDAEMGYRDNLGLKLIYRYNYDGEESRLYAVYVPVYGTSYAVDAFSGERIKVSQYYGPYPGMGAERAAMEKSTADAAGVIELTPEEKKAVEEVSRLLTRERAESIARGIKELEISRDYEVSRINLQKDWNVGDSYAWELNFEKKASSSERSSGNIWVRIDAKSGFLKGYSRYLPVEGESEGKYTEDRARKTVEEFMKTVYRDKFNDLEFDPAYEGHYYPLGRDENPVSYSFRYIRKVNGVQFPDNSVYLSFDAVNGRVVSLSMDWFDLEFPSLENVLEMEEVYNKLFEGIGLELVYSDVYTEGYERPEAGDNKPEIRLVYNARQEKPIIFDAFSGRILDYSGRPFVEKKAAKYTDIAGHFAEGQITALAEYGIMLPGDEFRPDESIIQKDFLYLLVKAMGYYGSFEDDSKLDEMYNLLIREKVVTKEEKNPDAFVTREEAVKFMVRSLKYQDVADIKGIFVTGFNDQGRIDPELIGYVAIAKGMNIIGGSGGNFYPKNSLTRAEAAVMLYNRLNG